MCVCVRVRVYVSLPASSQLLRPSGFPANKNEWGAGSWWLLPTPHIVEHRRNLVCQVIAAECDRGKGLPQLW